MKRAGRRRRLPGELDAVHPNAGTRALYRKRLERLIAEMNRSVKHWVRTVFDLNKPVMVEIAADTAAADLAAAMRDLSALWLRRFDRGAEELAAWFATDASQRSDYALRQILRKAGFSVRFQITPAMRDILEATVQANVALIKSIPREYLTQVEGMVMRSVQTGRDIGGLTKQIQQQFGVTKRRAALIAKDQNNKATSAMQKARQLELNLYRGVWIHSGGGKEPRPKHVAVDGQEFDIRKGMKVGDKGQWVMPGEEINCRCVWRAVVPGF